MGYALAPTRIVQVRPWQRPRTSASQPLLGWQLCSPPAPPISPQARLENFRAEAAAPTLHETPPHVLESVDMSAALSIDNVRQSLIRQEETIIFSLIERAQFARNDRVYRSEGIPVPSFSPSGQRRSLLEYLLRETEQIHGRIRRYTSPDEQAFYPEDLPDLVLPRIQYDEVLAPNHREISVNSKIMKMYLDHLLIGITSPGDDNNYGSAAMYDVLCLQALSKRIHYGKFVAEAKFRRQYDQYRPLIEARDAEGIMRTLTDTAVEQKVIERVRRKASFYGQDPGAAEEGHKVPPETVASLYEQWVMPLTKEVQVAYLLRRLEYPDHHLCS
ncbi:hypothetical protein WJX73_006188 [Symbiochloris irregularis]|uniref:chorismate mutase n=1 Tax=Symbiochloris irregularis TaxID=706552 RepID=A0AAW1NQY6_9CHLO